MKLLREFQRESVRNIRRGIYTLKMFTRSHLITLIFQRYKEEERELHLKKIKGLIKELENSKILERHLKKENKMYKKNKKNIIKENKELNKKVKKLENENSLIDKRAYRWLKEKNTWQYKYEK